MTALTKSSSQKVDAGPQSNGSGNERRQVQVIEMHMMDKNKYLPLTLLSSFSVRAMLYPFTLVKTRLQLQTQDAMYTGTVDALSKISRKEGTRGLYKGFWITHLFIFSQMSYIATYEGVRNFLTKKGVTNNQLKSFVGGGTASMVGQTFVVPIHIVYQHMIMILDSKVQKKSALTQRKNIIREPIVLPEEALRSPRGRSLAVVKAIHARDGLRGFYKGYLTSLAVYAPNSAMWWFFYDVYTGLLSNIMPNRMSNLAIQSLAAPLGGITTCCLTNPMDLIRTRIQIEGLKFKPTVRALWHQERWKIFTKGLSARVVHSATFSFFIILCYESIKHISLLDEYKKDLRW